MDNYFGESAISADNNVVPSANVYPGTGPSLANMGAPNSPVAMMYASDGQPQAVTPSLPATGVTGHPLSWWVGLAIVVAIIFYTARRTGNEGEFSNIRASTFNVSMITFIAILGLTLAKIVAVKIARVPGLTGLSSVILAS